MTIKKDDDVLPNVRVAGVELHIDPEFITPLKGDSSSHKEKSPTEKHSMEPLHFESLDSTIFPKSKNHNFTIIENEKSKVGIYAWVDGVYVEDGAKQQLLNIASLPIMHRHIAVMPDVHVGKGATVGSVIPTKSAIIPAAVGVDIGCGMIACKTSLTADDLPDNLHELRLKIEELIPHGRTSHLSDDDVGSWGRRSNDRPEQVNHIWKTYLKDDFEILKKKYQKLAKTNNINHLGTLGTGNHFIEICLDEDNYVWFMLHSGSRGVGNSIGSIFIEKAKSDMKEHISSLPDKDLAYLSEGTKHFDDYIFGVEWAQKYAYYNREIMMDILIKTVGLVITKPFTSDTICVSCHHNYISKEVYNGEELFITRKGAVSAKKGELGIIPGSMGAKSFIVEGLGNVDSYCSCSHGAGRIMSRTKAKKTFTIEDQIRATAGVECRKDESVIDETPLAYKDIDKVMMAQNDLVKIKHTLKQVLCVKG